MKPHPDATNPPPSHGRQSFSAVLRQVISQPGDRIRVSDIVDHRGPQAYAALLFVLASPNAIPILPPGIVTGTGLLMVALASQMLMNRETPKLPGWLSRRGIDRNHFRKAAEPLLPRLERLEGRMSRRLVFMFSGAGRRLMAFTCLLMALLMLLPIPFSNMAPGAAVALLALSLSQEDGLLALAGYAAALLSLGGAVALAGLAGWGASGLTGLFRG